MYPWRRGDDDPDDGGDDEGDADVAHFLLSLLVSRWERPWGAATEMGWVVVCWVRVLTERQFEVDVVMGFGECCAASVFSLCQRVQRSR